MLDCDLRGVDDAAVVAAIERGAAEEAAAAARRLAAVAELARRRCSGDARADWACDSWDAAAAEVAAALGVSHGRALGQIRVGLALAQRLPRVAALLAEGLLGYRVVTAIVWRTALVEDPEALGALDAALAAHCRTWGPLSEGKLERAIDTWVDAVDPAALRRSRARARSRDVEIGGRDDDSGTSALWGRLWATDAAVLRRRLAAMAAGVCPADPRTAGQRRADALGALAAGSTTLACRCGAAGCAAPAGGGSGAAVVIHVLAEPAALAAEPDPNLCGPGGPGFTRGMSLRDYLLGDPEPPATGPSAAAVILGGPAVPPALLAELIATGATVGHLRPPPDAPEPGYRPSAGLAQFVRMRDLTCRFPHCEVPAEHCDIDHAVPWPTGATHPANTRCLCRKHHLLKTFWGWTDTQHPDATITWTSPTGRTYTTTPGSRTLFPDWNTTTPAPPTPPATPPAQPAGHTPHRDLRMPRRRRSRLAEQTCRTRRERALNTTHVAERNKPPPF